MPACDCATNHEEIVLPPTDYTRAKRLLTQGQHPTFVGRDPISRCAHNGGVLVFTHQQKDVAVAIVNPRLSSLLVLNVHPDHRSHGLGAAIVHYLRPNFARVIEHRVPWFQKQGYVPIGALKQGRRFGTQVMVRAELLKLAGRVATTIGENCRCDVIRNPQRNNLPSKPLPPSQPDAQQPERARSAAEAHAVHS